MIRFLLSIVLMLLTSVVAVPVAVAGDGNLDPAFGPAGNGRVTIGIDSGELDVAMQVVPAWDGSIYLVGSTWPGIGIARLSADGVPDPGFAAVTYPADATNVYVVANAATQAVDGDLIVAGHYFRVSPIAGPFWVACRFAPDGTPDVTFGDGDIAPGCSDTFGTGTAVRGSINDLAIHSSNRIVFAGLVVDDAEKQRAAMSSLKANGAPDLSFANAEPGKENLLVPLANVVPQSRYLSLTRSILGDLLATGEYIISPADSDMLVTRHVASGVPAAGFGANGVAILPINLGPVGARQDIASGLAFTHEGTIAVVGSARHDNAGRDAGVVVWLKSNGSVDTAVANNGRRTFQMGETSFRLSDVVRAPRGRMVVGGPMSSGTDHPQVALMVALDAQGDPDPTFAAGGAMGFEFIDSTGMGAANASDVVDIALQGDRILVAGSAHGGDPANLDFAVARVGDGRVFSDGLESVGP